MRSVYLIYGTLLAIIATGTIRSRGASERAKLEMAVTLPYTAQCPMCEYSDTWMVIMSENSDERALSPREKRTFVEELAAEHPNHPKRKHWPEAS